MPDADLIIAGAGCAGLSALWHTMHSTAADRRVIVVDRRFDVGDDRTWAFWGTNASPFSGVADRTWDRLNVNFPGWGTTERLGSGRTYQRVRRRDYDSTILGAAERRPNIRFVAQDILDISDEPDGGVVVLPEGELRAPIVLQSTPLRSAGHAVPARHPLNQHFGGWEVHTQSPVFDPQVATLMDFDTDQLGATSFFYVLPEARDRALVEFTMFSPEPRDRTFYDEQLRRRLERLGAGDVSIERTEYGVIPMDDRRHDQRRSPHVWNLGTSGGMTKPTSGYTFQRIHAQTRRLVDHWAKGIEPTPLPSPPARYRFADRTLLSILHHHPELGRSVFEHLFRSTSIDDVLTFLDEDSAVRDDARMIARLPWRPFLRAGAGELAADLTAAVARGRK